ncbi:MAG: TetR/AcrR family transcriptional regulator [Myxococcota bacterium]|jgi:TetR/AcrR family transcriptional regulator
MVDTAPETSAEPSVAERIIEAARRRFAADGFDGTSLQAVADAVGIRKPSLLYHFRSKHILRRAVLDDVLAHWKSELPTLLARSRSGKDRFASGVGALVVFFQDDPSRARLIVREMLDQPALVQQLLAEHVRPWTGLVVDYIRMGQHAGQVRADVDAESYVVQVATMVIGTIATGDVARAMIPGDDTDGVANQIAELVRLARAGLFNVRSPN